MAEDILLSAGLDTRTLEDALKRIETRVDQMVKASDDRIKKMGEAVGTVVVSARNLIEVYSKLSESQMKPEERKKFDELKSSIMRTATALDALEDQLRSIEGIHVKYDDVRIEIPRNVLRDQIEKEIANIRGDILKQRLAVIMQTASGEVKERAAEMRADLVALLRDPSISGAKLRKEVAGIADEFEEVAKALRDVQEVGGVPRVESRETRSKELVLQEGQDLADRLTRIMEGSTSAVSEKANVMREDLVKAMKDPSLTAQQLQKDIDGIEKELDDVIEKANQQQQIGFGEVGTGGTGGTRATMERRNQEVLARAGAPELEERTRRLLNSTDDIVREGATRIKARLDTLFDVEGEEPEILAEFKKIKAEIAQFEQIKEPEFISGEGVSNLNAAQAKLEQIRAIQAATSSELDETTQRNIQGEERRAQAAIDAAKNRQTATKTEKEALQVVTDALSKTRLQVKAYQDQAKAAEQVAESVEEVSEQIDQTESISKKLDAKEAYNTLNANAKDANALLKSNDAEVRAIATELKRMGQEAKDAYEKGESSAKDFNDAQKKLRDTTTRLANAYGEDIPSSADHASISVWKLGNAVDRIGVRGVGGAIRIVDAFKGIPPAAIAGVVAVAALAAAVVKLTQTLADLAVRAAKAFGEFVKGSVESAQSVQVTDRQLGGLLRSPELGRGYRKLLQDTGFDVGLDLTKDFARVIVPLAGSVAEVEKAAEIAGTLAHAFQETEESISNAIKQAAGGHFRPLIERFGLTEFEIEKIKQYQESFGEFTGVLMGLEDALNMRGLNIGTLQGTLEFLIGQFDVLKEKVRTTVGEPVRDELGRQLQGLFGLIDTDGASFEQFFVNLGETIADVIATAGDIIRNFIGDIDEADMDALNAKVTELGETISAAIEEAGNLLGLEDTNLAEVLIDATDAAIGLTEALTELLSILDRLGGGIDWVTDLGTDFLNLGDIGSFIADAIGANITFGPRVSETLGKAIRDAVDPNVNYEEGELWNEFLNELFFWRDKNSDAADDLAGSTSNLAESERDAGAAAEESAEKTKLLIDERQKLVAQMREYEALQIKATAAQEKIDLAEGKLARDRTLQESQLRTRFDRQEIDLDIKRSQQREDLFAKHMQRMLQLTDDFNFDREQAGINFDRKEDDVYTKHADKLADIDRENAEKKIDIERKFRERLKDIRAKFDLDAEEAIRRNDAVALLRIRRRMQLELDQAKEQRDRQEKEADKSAENRREEAKIWLDRAIRDNDLAEERKLEDIRAADEQRRKQLIDQYNFEYEQIQVNYNRQRDAIAENERRALDDLDENFRKRQEDLDATLEDEYNTVKDWKDAETDYMRLKLKEQTNIIQQQYEIWRREGSLFRNLAERNFTGSGMLDQAGYGGTTATTGGIGDRVDNPFSRNYSDYVASQGYVGKRQHGGFVTSGNVYGINERGPEPFYATRAGIIASRDSFYDAPFLRSGVANIDNSRNVTADIYATDPTQMTPIQRTMMKHIITEELLSYGV